MDKESNISATLQPIEFPSRVFFRRTLTRIADQDVDPIITLLRRDLFSCLCQRFLRSDISYEGDEKESEKTNEKTREKVRISRLSSKYSAEEETNLEQESAFQLHPSNCR